MSEIQYSRGFAADLLWQGARLLGSIENDWGIDGALAHCGQAAGGWGKH